MRKKEFSVTVDRGMCVCVCVCVFLHVDVCVGHARKEERYRVADKVRDYYRVPPRGNRHTHKHTVSCTGTQTQIRVYHKFF